MIIADNITKYYKVKGRRHVIFQELSLSINPGDKLGLLGSNGAGKSTLLRLLCGIEAPNSGQVIRTSTISWPVGLTNGFIPTLTGKENIKFVCRLFGCTLDMQKKKIDFVRDFAEIGDYFDMPVSTYSSGMTSRLAYGMSMAFDFDFYVVDEGLSAGDAAFTQKSLAAFKEKSQDKGLLMVSHDMNTIKKFCNQALYLNAGVLYHSYDVDEVIARYRNAEHMLPIID